MTASLYGLENSNRCFSDPYYWGKNQFNSSFPVALACYMRDQQIPAVSLELNKDAIVAPTERTFDWVFNSDLPNAELFFGFESRFEPFQKFVHDDLKPIDLVVREADADKSFLRPLRSSSRHFPTTPPLIAPTASMDAS